MLPSPTPNAIPVAPATTSQPRTLQVGTTTYLRHTSGIRLPDGTTLLSDWWVPASEWPTRRW
jgi:hypothetical protein